ncbi:hypothetical protein TREMEDRAFT_61973 [Tremella mesenterica DSM 1558]|uniref:uncharacterized protein n=1 Tax=Tremella mesenterica (strain ATCC 24925 / CBS 8224 / DSM 1558 / NBRC 9311 / NRRL Y-6157 / RJB 2259-6 / UBC 559-6) TaxID=578456 RepID=UPI0003F4A0B7|nr:uncharacterized protein TREMEDRAFT_61973 [Tremella mesenterica DSM 1558]EIW70213.1 hypothetical protein TREMEDRAFT_61973 [Tremella mesenterica DSM 1558]
MSYPLTLPHCVLLPPLYPAFLNLLLLTLSEFSARRGSRNFVAVGLSGLKLWWLMVDRGLVMVKGSGAKLGRVRGTRDNGSQSTAKLDRVRPSRDNGSRSTAKLDRVRPSRDNGSRSTAKLDGVRLSRNNGSRSAAMLGGVSQRRRRMAGDLGKLDEIILAEKFAEVLQQSSNTSIFKSRDIAIRENPSYCPAWWQEAQIRVRTPNWRHPDERGDINLRWPLPADAAACVQERNQDEEGMNLKE